METIDASAIPLSATSSRLANVSADERTVPQTSRLNREILEAGFPGIILTEDIHRPYYYAIRAGYSYVYSLMTWLLIFGFLGLFHHYCNAESRFLEIFFRFVLLDVLGPPADSVSDSSLVRTGPMVQPG